MDFKDFENGPKMRALPEREQKFVWFYVTGENPTEAARLAGWVDNDNGAIRVRAHLLMHRDRVLDAIDEVGRKAFRGLLIPAINATKKLIEKPDHPDHSRTLQSTLSRLGISERTAVDVNHTGEVSVNHTDDALETLRVLRGLGVPREKLVETFGHSGLGRYEKMLADLEARQPKLIECEVINANQNQTS